MCPPENQPQEEGAHQTLWGQHTQSHRELM